MTSYTPVAFPAPMETQRGITQKPFVPAQANNLLLEMFGRPDGPYVLPNEALLRNLQPNDILRQYADQELDIPSSALTAAILNEKASVLFSLVPILETLQTNFSVQYMETNQIPYNRVTNYGIPREFSFMQWSESYTTTRKKQMARIEKNFLLDPKYGPPYWTMMLRTLGTNAKLTLAIDIISQLVEQPFRNMFAEQRTRNRFDHNVLFNAEQADFGIASLDQDAFFQSLIKVKPGRLPVPFDRILAPVGVFQRLKENAMDGGPIPTERIEYSEATKSIQAIVFNGGSSTKRIRIGDREVHLIEIDWLRCNMQDMTDKVFKPFETLTTFCEIVPTECGTGTQRWEKPIAHRFDVVPYVQSPTSGSHERVEFVRFIEHCFLWDRQTGEPSKYYTSFVDSLNDALAANPEINTPPQWQGRVDINDESEYGVDKYSTEQVQGKTSLKQMRGFREIPSMVVFDPSTKTYRLPEHVGDNHRTHLTDARVAQGAHLLVQAASRTGAIAPGDYNDIVDLVLAIRRTPFTEAYVDGLIAANREALGGGRGTIPLGAFNRHVRDGIPQVAPNEYGSLRLPSGYGANQQDAPTHPYPAGFGSWSGLMTLAKEADNGDSVWYRAGVTARRVLAIFEQFYDALVQYTPQSELVDGRNTAPWFHVEDGGRSVLLDTMVQLRTGEARPGPIFLAAEDGADDVQATHKSTPAEKGLLDYGREGAFTDRDEFDGLIKNRVHIDDWVAAGGNLTFEDLRGLILVARDVEDLIGTVKEINVTVGGGTKGTVVKQAGKDVAAALRKHMLVTTIKAGTLGSNKGFVQRLTAARDGITVAETGAVDLAVAAVIKSTDSTAVNAWKADKTNAVQLAQIQASVAAKAYMDVITSFNPKDTKISSKGLLPAIGQDYFDAVARGEPPKEAVGAKPFKLLRAPLEANTSIDRSTGINKKLYAADATKAYIIPVMTAAADAGARTRKDAFSPLSSALSSIDVSSLAYTLNTSALANVIPAGRDDGTTGYSGSYDADAMDLESSSSSSPYRDPASHLSSMFSKALGSGYFGDPEDVERVAKTAGSRTPYSIGASGAAGDATYKALFGPWNRRLDWLRRNVLNGFERVAALSILLSRNHMQTHTALAQIGACLMRFDAWRTGVQVQTAALVRMVGGSRTAFHALARISVVPYLEAVTGDFGAVAELFNGTVFTNRKNVDILPTSVLMQFIGGKGSDFIDDPAQLDLPATESPAFLVMPESENAGQVDYPRHLLNDDFYYQGNNKAPTPWRKHTYDRWARHLLGRRVDTIQRKYDDKSHYWGVVPRSLVGNRAFTYHLSGESDQFANKRTGTGGTGLEQLNTGDAWQAWNGKNAMPLAVGKPVPF